MTVLHTHFYVLLEKLTGPQLVEKIHVFYGSVSQSPGRGPVPGPGINYTGPREA